MKFVFAFLLLGSVAFGGEVKLRYRHIQNEEGKILATIDVKDGSIDYKEDPKKVVEVLIRAIDQAAQPAPVDQKAKK